MELEVVVVCYQWWFRPYICWLRISMMVSTVRTALRLSSASICGFRGLREKLSVWITVMSMMKSDINTDITGILRFQIPFCFRRRFCRSKCCYYGLSRGVRLSIPSRNSMAKSAVAITGHIVPPPYDTTIKMMMTKYNEIATVTAQ